MRLLTVLAATRHSADRVTTVLDRHDLEYSVTDETDGDSRTVIVPVPAHAVEPLEDDLQSVSGDIAVVVDEPMAVVATGNADDQSAIRHGRKRKWLSLERVSRNELRSKAESQLPPLVIFAAMTAISAVVATAGVLLDSLAVLVGAMVIAPLLGPAMASSVATVLDDRRLFSRGVRLQLVGTVVALTSALGFATFARTSSVVSAAVDLEASLGLGSHGLPPSLLVTVAICAGVAGGLAMATSGMTDLIGVMIAAAVMPPVGVVGVGTAWTAPTAVTGSLVVIVVNVLAINLGAIATLWSLGFHPRDRSRILTTRTAILRRALVLLALLALAIHLMAIVSGSL